MNMNQQQNHIQYILAGSVPSSNLKFLLHRLKGLCDQAAITENYFEDHEAVYIIKVIFFFSYFFFFLFYLS